MAYNTGYNGFLEKSCFTNGGMGKCMEKVLHHYCYLLFCTEGVHIDVNGLQSSTVIELLFCGCKTVCLHIHTNSLTVSE